MSTPKGPMAPPIPNTRDKTTRQREEGPAQSGRAARHPFHALLASPEHVLVDLTCWCSPYLSADDPEIIIHREVARG